MAGVKFEHVYKAYQKVETIADFNLEIQDKEFLVLVGPSGCGKSTTLRMIAGLEDITGGKLYIGDRLVNKIPPQDRNIAMVFQNYALYPHLSVAENMGFSLRMKRVPTQEVAEKVQAAAKILGLENLLHRKPKELSGGQRQRVAIGRAIVRDPQVFLFDEPLSNLDAKLRVQMRVELSKLHKKLNTTIVYVTHDQIEAMTLADRIVVMKDGFIQQVGRPIDLYQHPNNAFVGQFIGSPAMNQVALPLCEKEQRLHLQGQDIEIDIHDLQEQLQLPGSSQQQREMILGVRPEDIHIASDLSQAHFQAQLEVIEPIGSESYLYFSLENQQWVAKCEGLPKVKEGETVPFRMNKENLHFFAASGEKESLRVKA